MNNEAYKLNIDKPCSENWEKMTLSESGKFCSNCCKNVIDFTKMSNEDIIKYISNSKGNICGRLSQSQSEIKFYPINQSSNRTLFKTFFSSFLLLSTLVGLNAQKDSLNQTGNVHIQNSFDEKGVEKFSIKNAPTKITVSGQVRDSSDNEVLTGASVYIIGTEYGVVTDAYGKFIFETSSESSLNEISIKVTYTGYKSQIIKLDPDNLKDVIVYMPQDYILLGGFMGLIAPPEKTKEWWQFWK